MSGEKGAVTVTAAHSVGKAAKKMARQKLITKVVEKAIQNAPYGTTDGQGGKAKVIARIFGGRFTAYILEGYQLKGEKWDGNTVYGLVDIGYGFEYGPFNLNELKKGYLCRTPWGDCRLPFERDIFVDCNKMTLEECVKNYRHERHPWMNY